MKNIYQSAFDNWAEDEAYGLIKNWENALENGYTEEEIRVGVTEDVLHMIKVFNREGDADNLIDRFIREVSKVYPHVTKA